MTTSLTTVGETLADELVAVRLPWPLPPVLEAGEAEMEPDAETDADGEMLVFVLELALGGAVNVSEVLKL